MEDFFVGEDDSIKMKPWMKTKNFVLGTAENIEAIMDHCIQSERYALDVETTGLDNRVLDHGGVMKTVDQLVGVCLSPDGVTGYYIPLNHVEVKIDGSRVRYPSNVPWDVFEKAFRRLITATEEKQTVAIFHNGKFDHEFLNYWGGEPFGTWDKTFMWDDTLILAYLSDSRRRQKGLKFLAKELLDMEMIELKELIPDEVDEKGRKRPIKKDFSKLDPEEPSTLWYGGGDGICTRLLYDILAPDVLEPKHGFDQILVYKIEKQCVAATRWMERNRIHLDKEKLGELIQVGHKEWFASIMDVYADAEKILNRDVMPGVYKSLQNSFVDNDPTLSIKDQLKTALSKAKYDFPDPVAKVVDAVGKEWPPIYDVNAAQQLGVMFEDMGVEGLKRTEKSGQIKTSKDELDRIIEEAGKQFPFMAKIKRFREISKALSTYLYPMFNDSDHQDDTMRINFQGHKVDTGRFSTPAKEISSKSENYMVGWPAVNLQALPRTGGTQRPECMQRLRECVTARRPNRVIAAIDYAGVELRLVTNLSKEPLWLAEFFHCSGCGRVFDRGDGQTTPEPPPARCPNCGSDKIGDLHTLTGISVYGKEAQANPDWKELRGHAKCVHPDTVIPVKKDKQIYLTPQRIGSFPVGSVDTFQIIEGWKVWNGQESIAITETYNGGEKELYHIVTRRGILTCSDKHRLKMADGSLKSLSEGLSKGDLLANVENKIFCDCSTQSWPIIPVRPLKDIPETYLNTDHHIAYLAGAFLGDGSKAGINSVSLCHGNIAKADKMGVSYKDWQNILVQACQDAGFDPKPKKERVYIGSRHVMRIFTSLGLIEATDDDKGKRLLRVPDWILGGGHEAIMYFMGGLFDTDGTVGKRDGMLSMCTKDAIFAGQVASVLHFIGVVPHCEASWNSTYSRWYYRVRVSGSQAPLFKAYLKHPGKQARIQERKTGLNPSNAVTRIIPAGKMPCMDLHIQSNDHLYWASGVISHNSLNFALCYGGGGSAAQRATGVDRNEGNRMKRQFDGTYRTLSHWWDSQHVFAKQHGFVVTAFKRRYPLPDILHADGGFRSKAERNAVNGPIQGTSADITKIAMGLIYNACNKRGWLDKVQMIITMHDELVFEIDLDILEEALSVITPLMCRNVMVLSQKWPVPLTVDVEIGRNWTVPWDLNAIKYKEVRFIGDKKYYPPKAGDPDPWPDGYTWDNMATWPETLHPFFKAETGTPVADPPQDPTIQEKVVVVEPAVENASVETPPVSVEAIKINPEDVEPTVPSGGIFEYQLHRPLTLETLYRLAQTINQSKNTGTRVLHLRTMTGEELDLEKNYGKVLVNTTTFNALAKVREL